MKDWIVRVPLAAKITCALWISVICCCINPLPAVANIVIDYPCYNYPPPSTDSDGDGYTDCEELALGTNRLDSSDPSGYPLCPPCQLSNAQIAAVADAAFQAIVPLIPNLGSPSFQVRQDAFYAMLASLSDALDDVLSSCRLQVGQKIVEKLLNAASSQTDREIRYRLEVLAGHVAEESLRPGFFCMDL